MSSPRVKGVFVKSLEGKLLLFSFTEEDTVLDLRNRIAMAHTKTQHTCNLPNFLQHDFRRKSWLTVVSHGAYHFSMQSAGTESHGMTA